MQGSLKIILALVTWGSLGIFVRHIDLPTLEVAFMRAAIAMVVLGIAGIWLRGKDSIQSIKANLPQLLASGIGIGLNWVLLFQAYRYTTIANATLSYYMSPVIMVLLAPLVLKEKITPGKLAAVFTALGGLFIILSQQPEATGIQYQHLKGLGLGLIAAAFYAGVVLVNKTMRNINGYELTMVQIVVAAIVLLPFIIYRGELQIASGDWPWILTLGIIHTGVAYLLYFSGIKEVPAQKVAVLSYIDPISAIFFGTLFLHEALTLYQVLGGALILGAAFYSARTPDG